jgi:hypothetical protein
MMVPGPTGDLPLVLFFCEGKKSVTEGHERRYGGFIEAQARPGIQSSQDAVNNFM